MCKTGEGIRAEQRVKYIPLDATSPDWPVDDGAFDIVLMTYISGSVPEPIIGALYANASKALKPKGWFLVHDFMVIMLFMAQRSEHCGDCSTRP